MKRRLFILKALSLCLIPWGCTTVPPKSLISTDESKTINAILNHLLPSNPTTPGASKINATNYIISTFSRSDIDIFEKNLFISGLKKIESISLKTNKKPFHTLDSLEREIVLRSFEKNNHGTTWLRMVLNYLMEALLGDPIYGGNTKKIGWSWLKIKAGFPRPTLSQRYFKL